MRVDRQYIFTLYQMGVGAIYSYLQQIEKRVEDAEARVISSQQAKVERLSKELSSTKRTLVRKSQALIMERQLNRQLLRRIRELEREIERGAPLVERDSHNSNLPPSLDLPWKKPPRTRSLRKKSELKVGGQPRHPRSTLRQVAQPDDVILHAPAACQNCGAPVQAREERSDSVRAGGHLMCLSSDELLVGPLIDFHTRSIRANVWVWARAWMSAEQPQLKRYGILHLVRDVFGVSGFIETNERGRDQSACAQLGLPFSPVELTGRIPSRPACVR
jgi:hypothetical protein